MQKILFVIFISLISMAPAIGQLDFEICDNGIDDDMDGFIDLNDSKCNCENELPSSLIPNPSFEDRTCCPSANAMLDCAVDWVQASAATTDYINICGGYLGNTSIPAVAPLPLPDGDGAVGFRDGQGNAGENYKEYVGACLSETMLAGVDYKLQFYVGFRDNVLGSKSLDIAIFGGTTCNQLPFGNGSSQIGCPSNTSTYDQIDIQFVSGSNEWVSVEFEFTPTKDYEVIIIGPSCEAHPNWLLSPYFYLDGLTLAETSDFGVPFENVEGSICNDDLVLSIEENQGQTYQWYKDGIAIIGATNNTLSIINSPDSEGTYLAVITSNNGCVSSKNYVVRVPPYYADQTVSVCENEGYSIENTNYNQSGIYETTIEAVDGCDSIITLDLKILPNTFSELDRSFCEGDTFDFMSIVATSGGIYTTTLLNSYGCDSIITVYLEEIPTTSGIEITPLINVLLGDIIDIEPISYDPQLITFQWSNSNNEILSTESILSNLQPFVPDTYYITGMDQYGCDITQKVEIQIDRSSIAIHAPNIFSPDDNGINDYFNFESGNALSSIESFIVFDRWGNIVFNKEDILDLNNFQGWDGYVKGKQAEQGVYGWMIKANFIDNTTILYSGDLTLIRLK